MNKIILKRRDPNNPQIKSYVEAIKKGNNSQHVVPRNSRWAVRSGGNSKTSKIFNTQKAAINYAKTTAKNNNSSFFLHGVDGRIRDRGDY
jgi:hypothetical protein